jgi:sugar phosphate isomerase/epimerase
VNAHPRYSLNQATVKRASLAEAIHAAQGAGISSIGVWREPVAEIGLDAATRLIADSGLRVSSNCRGGFFTPRPGSEWVAALDDNRRAIDETAALAAAGAVGSAAVLVLVAGGLPEGDRDLIGARERVRDALGELEPYAASAGVTLAVEALHPMFAADRAVVSTLAQAIDLAVEAGTTAGVVVDTYHLWWDPEVLAQIERAGRLGRIASYQVCDWLTPLPVDNLLGRGIPGDGHIDFGPITRAVAAAGYGGDIECEIFNAEVWARPYDEVAAATAEAFTRVVAPHL